MLFNTYFLENIADIQDKVFFPSNEPGKFQEIFQPPFTSRVQQNPGNYQNLQQAPQVNYDQNSQAPQPENNPHRRQGQSFVQPNPTSQERREALSTNSFRGTSPAPFYQTTAVPSRQNFNQLNGNGNQNPSINTEDQRIENNPSRPNNKPQFNNGQPNYGPQNVPNTPNRGSAENNFRPSAISPNTNQFANRPNGAEGSRRPASSEEQAYGTGQNGLPGIPGQSHFGGLSSNNRRPAQARPQHQQASSEETEAPKFGDYKPISKFAWQLFQVT